VPFEVINIVAMLFLELLLNFARVEIFAAGVQQRWGSALLTPPATPSQSQLRSSAHRCCSCWAGMGQDPCHRVLLCVVSPKSGTSAGSQTKFTASFSDHERCL